MRTQEPAKRKMSNSFDGICKISSKCLTLCSTLGYTGRTWWTSIWWQSFSTFQRCRLAASERRISQRCQLRRTKCDVRARRMFPRTDCKNVSVRKKRRRAKKVPARRRSRNTSVLEPDVWKLPTLSCDCVSTVSSDIPPSLTARVTKLS